MWKQIPLCLAVVFLASYALGDSLCANNNGGCGNFANCYGGYNGASSITCVCINGYYMTTAGCVGVNACATNNGNCDPHATCTPTIGTYNYVCTCNPPYVGVNGFYCSLPAVNLCATNNGGCGPNAGCFGGDGATATCVCNNGYYMSSGSCVAVNVCKTNNGGCDATLGVCTTVEGTYVASCACIAGYAGDGHYCYLPATIPTGPGIGGAIGGETVAATGLTLRRRIGTCSVVGCVDLWNLDQLDMNKYVTPCDVEGTGLACGNSPSAVNGFLLEANAFLFGNTDFLAPQTVAQIHTDQGNDLQIFTDTAAVIEGYIWGPRNTDAFFVSVADDVMRTMIDFNQDGSFTSGEWGGNTFGVKYIDGGVSILTTGHFNAPGCYHIKSGYYNGPSLTEFHLVTVPSANVDTVNPFDVVDNLVPASRFFKTLADCPTCSCPSGYFISADCTATTNAVCTPCCDSTKCQGTETADPAPNCAVWDCPSPPVSYFDWRYHAPGCDSLSVTYPADLPAGQGNDCNIRIKQPDGTETTLNFHDNTGDFSADGTHTFDYRLNPNWPASADTTGYIVEWVQVGGSNCHWTGSLQCPLTTPPDMQSPGTQSPGWDWTYPTPACNQITIDYPAGIPAGNTNDVNVHVVVNGQTIGINFHQAADWGPGPVQFNIAAKLAALGYPTGTPYTIVWVQVGGTNYHWNGNVPCTE